jgi:hypothetical protein
MRALVILLLGAVAAPANAAPAYLKCFFPSRDKTFEVQITADEANSAVTVFMPSTGHTEKMAAVFTPTQVLFQSRMMSYTLSRTDLTIRRVVPIIKADETGTCEVVKAPERAF